MDFSLLETGLIWAIVKAVEPASRHCLMYPEDIPVWRMQQGRVRLRHDDEEAVAGPGHWIFPPRGSVWHDFSDDAIVLSIRFRLRWPNGRELFDRSRTLIKRDGEAGAMREAAETLVRCFASESPRADLPAQALRHLAQQAALFHWLGSYVQAVERMGLSIETGRKIDPRVVRAQRLLDEAAIAKRLSRQRLAADVGWSLPQLTRRFKTEHGITAPAVFRTTPDRVCVFRAIPGRRRHQVGRGRSRVQLAFRVFQLVRAPRGPLAARVPGTDARVISVGEHSAGCWHRRLAAPAPVRTSPIRLLRDTQVRREKRAEAHPRE